MAQAKNKSEHMFVEWAQGIEANNYDVERVAELLNGLNNDHLHGLDIGGGIGRYAQLVCEKVPGCSMTILDKSELAVESFVEDPRLTLECIDFFTFEPDQLYDFIIFKTVLHHFIADNESDTAALQQRALHKARQLLRPGGLLLIEENFYQGVMCDDLPGRVIFTVTRQRWIEDLVRRLGANTAGEGVRFKSLESWKKMITGESFVLRSLVRSPTWGRTWPLWQRLPLISSGRFQGVLEARATENTPEQTEPFIESRYVSGLTPPLGILAKLRVGWQKASSRLRWLLALSVAAAPLSITTYALIES